MTPPPPARFTLPHDSTLDDLLQTIRERSSLQLAAWKREEQQWRDRVVLSEGQIRMLQQEVTKLRDTVDEWTIVKGSYANEITRLRDALAERDAEIDTLRAMISEEDK